MSTKYETVTIRKKDDIIAIPARYMFFFFEQFKVNVGTARTSIVSNSKNINRAMRFWGVGRCPKYLAANDTFNTPMLLNTIRHKHRITAIRNLLQNPSRFAVVLLQELIRFSSCIWYSSSVRIPDSQSFLISMSLSVIYILLFILF